MMITRSASHQQLSCLLQASMGYKKREDGVSSGSSLVQVTQLLRVHEFKGHAQRTELSTHSTPSYHSWILAVSSAVFAEPQSR